MSAETSSRLYSGRTANTFLNRLNELAYRAAFPGALALSPVHLQGTQITDPVSRDLPISVLPYPFILLAPRDGTFSTVWQQFVQYKNRHDPVFRFSSESFGNPKYSAHAQFALTTSGDFVVSDIKLKVPRIAARAPMGNLEFKGNLYDETFYLERRRRPQLTSRVAENIAQARGESKNKLKKLDNYVLNLGDVLQTAPGLLMNALQVDKAIVAPERLMTSDEYRIYVDMLEDLYRRQSPLQVYSFTWFTAGSNEQFVSAQNPTGLFLKAVAEDEDGSFAPAFDYLPLEVSRSGKSIGWTTGCVTYNFAGTEQTNYSLDLKEPFKNRGMYMEALAGVALL